MSRLILLLLILTPATMLPADGSLLGVRAPVKGVVS